MTKIEISVHATYSSDPVACGPFQGEFHAPFKVSAGISRYEAGLWCDLAVLPLRNQPTNEPLAFVAKLIPCIATFLTPLLRESHVP